MYNIPIAHSLSLLPPNPPSLPAGRQGGLNIRNKKIPLFPSGERGKKGGESMLLLISVYCFLAKHLLDTEKLVVFTDPVCSAGRAGFDLA
jgi:hypothetical protein